MKSEVIKTFGQHLAFLRKERGLTQAELAEMVGISRRALIYYEVESDRPPAGDILIKLADALELTVDQLLGRDSVTARNGSRKEARLLNKLKKVKKLSKQDQKAVIRYIDALFQTSESN